MHYILKKWRKLTILKILCKLHPYFDTFTEVGVYWNMSMCRKYMNGVRPWIFQDNLQNRRSVEHIPLWSICRNLRQIVPKLWEEFTKFLSICPNIFFFHYLQIWDELTKRWSIRSNFFLFITPIQVN